MPELTPDPIANDRAPHRASDDKPHSRGHIRRSGAVFTARRIEMDDQAQPARPPPAANGSCEVGTQPQPGRGRQHEGARIRRR